MPRMPAATTCRPARPRTHGVRMFAKPANDSTCRNSGFARSCASSSGGNQYQNGQLITSSAGAMGLMQVMPETYDELQGRYSLGDDPFDPHDNILAGTAYLREMYDIYGSPGFLAAYNAGPRRLDDYLSNNRSLPDETRRYVAMIGPNIVGVYPTSRSPAEDYAMNALPIDIPRGTRYGRATQVASSRGGGGRAPMRGPVEVAQLPEPPRPAAQSQPQQYALATPPSDAARRIPIDPAGCGGVDADASRRSAVRSVGNPGGRLFQRAHGPCRTRQRARARTDRAGGRAHLGVRRAPGRARAVVSRAAGPDCRATPRCRRANASRMAARTAWCCRRSRSRRSFLETGLREL